MSMSKVVKVTKTEFELEDGRVFPHVEPLDEVPTVEEFQAIYDHWSEIVKNEVNLEHAGTASGAKPSL